MGIVFRLVLVCCWSSAGHTHVFGYISLLFVFRAAEFVGDKKRIRNLKPKVLSNLKCRVKIGAASEDEYVMETVSFNGKSYLCMR